MGVAITAHTERLHTLCAFNHWLFYRGRQAVDGGSEGRKGRRVGEVCGTCHGRDAWEDLVYHKHSGVLIGFFNLRETRLAKTIFVFMVRGLFTQLEFQYAQFPCTDISGELLFAPFGEAVYRLERIGLRVSTNRHLIKLYTQPQVWEGGLQDSESTLL